MKIIGLIPARMASSRFPGKPLVDIGGLPMIVHVMKRAALCRDLSDIFVATDSAEIAEVVGSYGGKAIMTSPQHQTGTDRIAEAAKNIDYDLAVNIQGDEALLDPAHISSLISAMQRDPGAKFATLICKARHWGDITDCKVVFDTNNNILYMSRADIPSPARVKAETLYKLYCIVAFRKPYLEKFASWPQTPLERIEYIEYLRIVENGYPFKAVPVDDYKISVDTPKDLETVSAMMKEDKVRLRYV